MAFLEGPSPKQAEMIKSELGEGPEELEKGVRDLRSMCAANPYLPQPEVLGGFRFFLIYLKCSNTIYFTIIKKSKYLRD